MRDAQATFLLHGFRSSGEDMIRHWPWGALDPPTIALDGPELDVSSSTRRWFAFTALTERLATRVRGAAAAATLDIVARLRCLGVPADAPIAVVGHSQGAMVALELLRSSSLSIVDVCSYAGWLPATELKPVTNPTGAVGARVRLYSSRADHFVPSALVADTTDWLRRCSFDAHHFVAADLDHSFGPGWLEPERFELLQSRCRVQ